MNNKKVHLPLITPLYSTYHVHGWGSAVIGANPSIRNWYLNNAMQLTCTRQFLNGYTSPRLNIWKCAWNNNPHLEQKWYEFEFLGGYVNPVIRALLDKGYYVYFLGVDDYYIEGKSLYGQRHYRHDGLICGYDQTAKTYDIFAYDASWMYREFSISQASFNKGRKAAARTGDYGHICGIKPLPEPVAFEPETVMNQLREYLEPTPEKYAGAEEYRVFGIVVHDYLSMYVEKLYDKSIPYERMDWRIFRIIWEHKTVMLERLIKTEKALNMAPEASTRYTSVADDANSIRMLYASYHLKEKASILPAILKKLAGLRDREENILKNFVNQSEFIIRKRKKK